MTEAAGKFGVLTGKELILRLKTGAGNRVFGAVTPSLLVDEVKAQFGIVLERRHVMLEDPIKQLGEFIIPLRASADITGELRINVLPELKKGQSAEQQLKAIAAQRAAAQQVETPAAGNTAVEEEATLPDSEEVAEELAEAVELDS
jgi:large subunit ribosomal protein L9